MPSRLLWEHFEFLSTPSARRATGFGAQTPSGGYDFYPRPPRGGRQDSETNGFRIIKFLSTPSARRATTRPPRPRRWHSISIHALREEGDPDAPRLTEMRKLFLSTPSARRATGHRGHGERCRVFLSTPSARRATFKRDYSLLTTIFLSTPSARRATTTMWTNSSQASISIHALREEGDYNPFVHTCFFGYFYPRPPRGGRRGIVTCSPAF